MTDWFRSWHGAPTDPKWLGIAKRAGVAPGIAVAVGWALMDRASQAEDRGCVAGYDAEGLACFFGCEADQVDALVTAMADKGMICDGRFASWEKRQPKREDASAERAKQWRERNRTQANADERQDTEVDIDTEKKDTPTDVGVERASAPDISSPLPEKPSSDRKAKATRIPAGWKPSAEGRAYAVEHGFSQDDIRAQAEGFVDWSLAAPGDKGLKRDWDAAWRNWVRNAVSFGRIRGPDRQGSPVLDVDPRTGDLLDAKPASTARAYPNDRPVNAGQRGDPFMAGVAAAFARRAHG